MEDTPIDEEAVELTKLKEAADAALDRAEKMKPGPMKDKATRAALKKLDEYRFRHSLWLSESEEE